MDHVARDEIVIHVRGYLTYRELLGRRSLVFPAGDNLTLRSLLDHIKPDLTGFAAADVQLQPDTGEDQSQAALRTPIVILLNGRAIRNLPNGLEMVLQDGDEVSVFPPIAGGSTSMPSICTA